MAWLSRLPEILEDPGIELLAVAYRNGAVETVKGDCGPLLFATSGALAQLGEIGTAFRFGPLIRLALFAKAHRILTVVEGDATTSLLGNAESPFFADVVRPSFSEIANVVGTLSYDQDAVLLGNTFPGAFPEKAAAAIGPRLKRLFEGFEFHEQRFGEATADFASGVVTFRHWARGYLCVVSGEGGPAESLAAESESQWTEARAARLQALLAEHVGPIAKVLVARGLKIATPPLELLAALSNEIPDPMARSQFIEKGRSLLSE